MQKDILSLCAEAFLSAPVIDTSVALEVRGITAKSFGAVKDKLVKLYGDTELVADGGKQRLCDLTAAQTLTVDAKPDFEKCRYNVADALRVIEMLTRDEGGCPWDKAQTHESIRINMVEEAYEAVDAIDKRDAENMREEFGDVFLQSILQSDIARRAGEFDFSDVCDELSKKLISRHSWIFGGDTAENADEALTAWEKNKGIEKHYDGVKNQLERLPDTFPSLLYAQKTYKKMKKGGMADDAQGALKAALEAKDYVGVIDACVGLLADAGADAEVELNKRIKQKISEL